MGWSNTPGGNGEEPWAAAGGGLSMVDGPKGLGWAGAALLQLKGLSVEG